MQDIKPIETVYNGYRFRSRLEARWAVFFDALGVKYEYEPEGIVLSNGSYYLPDFYLYELKTYVEIKPVSEKRFEYTEDGVEFPKELGKYAYAAETITGSNNGFFVAFGDPYDAFPHIQDQNRKGDAFLFFNGECIVHSTMNNNTDIVVECSTGEKCSECNHFMYACCETPLFLWKYGDGFGWVVPNNRFISKECRTMPFELILEATRDGEEKIVSYTFIDEMNVFQEKMLKARQARFEHGETPKF